MSIEFTIRKGTTNPTSGSGITLGEPAFNYSNNTLWIGKGYGVTAAWVGADICGASGGIDAGLTYQIPTLGAVKDYFTAVSSNFLGTTAAYVASFNGRTGAVQGVSAAVAGTGISVSGATGSVTITNTGVQSFNGLTGAVTGASLGANTFTALNSFNAGISASGATFSGSIGLQNAEFIRNTTNGRIDLMPAPSSPTAYGMYFDMTSWTYGIAMGTIKSSDGVLNNGNFRFDAPLTIANGVNFNLGGNGQNFIACTSVGLDTTHFSVNTSTGTNSGAFAIVSENASGNANRSPVTAHTNPNLYVYRRGATSANDFIRVEHDGTNGNIVSGGTSGILIQPGSGVLGISGGISAGSGVFSSYISTATDLNIGGAIYSSVSNSNYIDLSDGTVRIGDSQGNDTGQFIYYEQAENTLYGGGLNFQAGTFSSTASIGDFVQIGAGGGIVDSQSTALGTTAANQIISQTVVSTLYRSAEFFVQASTAGGAYEALKIMVVHDGVTTYNTQYGVIRSGANLGTYTTILAAVAGQSRIRLRVTPTAVNTTYKVMITALPV